VLGLIKKFEAEISDLKSNFGLLFLVLTALFTVFTDTVYCILSFTQIHRCSVPNIIVHSDIQILCMHMIAYTHTMYTHTLCPILHEHKYCVPHILCCLPLADDMNPDTIASDKGTVRHIAALS
jgi:hypothetical protein